MKVLAGDIGGTHTRLAIVESGGPGARPRVIRESTLASQDAPGLAPLVREFLAAGREQVRRACFGVAGPVRTQRVRATNLPWTIDGPRLARAIGVAGTTLINDFAAIGHGIGALGARDLKTLQRGQAIPRGPIAVIGAGTGLGEGFLTWRGERYEVHSSEGGHATFAARTPVEWDLARHLSRRFGGHVSWERVLSGPGLVSIYRYLAGRRPGLVRRAVTAEMRRGDPAAVVSRHALAGTDRLSERALDLFVSCLGAQAANLALTVLATGGVYVAGGIAPLIVSKLAEPRFLEAFRDKGRLAPVLARMPVHVIMNPKVGLLGAAAVAARIRL